jgi:hypothetical protein
VGPKQLLVVFSTKSVFSWGFSTISGGGCIAGNDRAFMDVITQYHISGVVFPRPTLSFFGNCQKITIQQVKLHNLKPGLLKGKPNYHRFHSRELVFMGRKAGDYFLKPGR